METKCYLMFRQSIFMLTLIIAGLCFVSAATADQSGLQTCTSVTSAQSYEDELAPYFPAEAVPGCVINWVQTNRLLQVTWYPLADLHEEEVVLSNVSSNNVVLRSSRPPHLLDVNGDGWLDLTSFELYGMVNGGYYVFLYDPYTSQFVRAGEMFGHTFIRETNEYFVSASRNNAATINFEFYELQNERLTPVFHLEVSAHEASENGGRAQCASSIDGESFTDVFDSANPTDFFANHPEMIQHYCDTYRGLDEERRGTDLIGNDDELNVVPEGTIFYCRLEGSSKAVTVSRDGLSYQYAYGSVGGEPELSLNRTEGQVSISPQMNIQQFHVGEVRFQNGDYTYVVYYSYDNSEAGDAAFNQDYEALFRERSFTRGLRVFRGENSADVVFDKACRLNTSYDVIPSLGPS